MLNKKSIIFTIIILLCIFIIIFMYSLKNTISKKNEFMDFQLYQDDYAYLWFGESNFAVNGSSIIALTTVINSLYNKNIGPEEIVYLGRETNYYTENNELDLTFIQATIKHFNRLFNLDIKCTETNDINDVILNIKNGAIAISAQKKGLFTEKGHFIVLYDIDKNEKIKIKDPNKTNAIYKKFNDKTFTTEQIDTSSIRYWIFTKN